MGRRFEPDWAHLYILDSSAISLNGVAIAKTFLGITNAVNFPASHEITGHKSVRKALRNTEKYSSDLQGDGDVRHYVQISRKVDPQRHHLHCALLAPYFVKSTIEKLALTAWAK